MSANELPPPPYGAIARTPNFSGDALARLIQLEAWKCGIDGWKNIDKGVQAVPALMCRLFNAEMRVRELQAAIKTIHEDGLKCKDLEGVIATVTVAILRAHANYDLNMKTWGQTPT